MTSSSSTGIQTDSAPPS
nr:unnamed protein product [Callosobruchus chinensis]